MPASTQLHGDSSSSESVSCTTLQSTNTSAMSSTTMRTNGRERVKNNTAELELMTSVAKRCMEDPESDFIGVSDDVKFRRANVTECVPVASSDHVAEIVGKQGAKIKALRLRTSTYIKTPCRGDEPVFIITGRREDVMIAKQEILSAADQVSMLRARRSLQQVSANGTASSNATEAIAASNLLAASAASFNLVPTLPAAVAALNNLNAAALMNAGLTNPAVNLAGVSMAALNATTSSAGYATSLQNALLSNLAAAAPTSLQQTLASSALSQTLPAATLLQRSATNGPAQNRAPQQQATTSQLCAAPSRSSASPAGNDAPNQAGSAQNAQTSASKGVTPINLATMSNSRVLSRLALASGATHGNPMAVLNALNGGGLLAGLPSYMPPGFNLATAKHIAQLRVPERIVGLVVGPRGATIKQIQQKTNTYILTPSKGDRDAVFEIIGTAEGCATAKQDIEDYVLSRTGMTVDQLLSQQSQVRTLEAICQAAGLNVNRLVTNALANVPPPNVDLASLGLGQPLATSVAGSQLGIAHLSEALTAAANPGATTLQDHLQMMGAATRAPKVANSNGSDAYTTDGDVTSAIQSLLASLVARKSSDQLQPGVSDVNASDRLRLFENGWLFDGHTLKGTDAEAEAEDHNGITNGMAATQSDLMNHSMFDAVYENLNSLVSGLDDTSMTLVDRENDVPHYSTNLRVAHHNAEAPNFGNTYAMPASNSTLTAASRFENDAADVAVPERRSSASLKSLLAGLGLDTALCVGGPSSSGFASPSTSTTSGLGASLNGFAASGYQQRAATTNGASSASSGGSSPAFDMFNSRGMPTDNLLHTLTAMRI